MSQTTIQKSGAVKLGSAKVEIGDTVVLKSAADLATFKAIRTGSTSGVLKVTYSE